MKCPVKKCGGRMKCIESRRKISGVASLIEGKKIRTERRYKCPECGCMAITQEYLARLVSKGGKLLA